MQRRHELTDLDAAGSSFRSDHRVRRGKSGLNSKRKVLYKVAVKTSDIPGAGTADPVHYVIMSIQFPIVYSLIKLSYTVYQCQTRPEIRFFSTTLTFAGNQCLTLHF